MAYDKPVTRKEVIVLHAFIYSQRDNRHHVATAAAPTEMEARACAIAEYVTQRWHGGHPPAELLWDDEEFDVLDYFEDQLLPLAIHH